MLTKEILEEKGFVFESLENGLFQHFSKKVKNNNSLVIEVAPMQEIYIWCPDEDSDPDDPEADGVRIVLDTDDLDLAEKCAEIILGFDD